MDHDIDGDRRRFAAGGEGFEQRIGVALLVRGKCCVALALALFEAPYEIASTTEGRLQTVEDSLLIVTQIASYAGQGFALRSGVANCLGRVFPVWRLLARTEACSIGSPASRRTSASLCS
jgi:hypothetical protein